MTKQFTFPTVFRSVGLAAVTLLTGCRHDEANLPTSEVMAQGRAEGIAKFESDPGFFNVKDYYVLGRFYFEDGKYEPAAKLFLQYADAFPSDSRGWIGLGNAYAALTNWTSASTAYGKADSLGEPEALPMLVACCLTQEEYAKAEALAPRLAEYVRRQERGSSAFWQSVCLGLWTAVASEPPNKAQFEQFAALLPKDESLWRADARDWAERGFKLFGRSVPAKPQKGERQK
jgi:tetratricopeptide (TPR) repeat protein